jgi:hypothetical protein
MGVLDFLWQGAPPPATTTYGTATTGIPQFLSDYTQGLLSKSNAIAAEPFQAYGGPRIAQFTPDQQSAFQMTRDVAGDYTPGINQAYDIARGTTGMNALVAGAPFLGQAAGTFTGGNVAQYMNPYIGNVVNRIGELAGRNLQEQLMPAIGDQFIKAGQYGSSTMQQTVGRALRDVQESALAQQNQALAQGYQTAGQLYGQDMSRIAGIGQTAGNLTSQAARDALAASQQMGTLSNLGQSMSLRDAAALEAVGQTQQQQNQRNLDVAYQDFLEQREYPKTQAGFLSSMLRGIPYGTSTSTSQTGPSNSYQPSPLAQIAGSAALVSALGGMKFAEGGEVKKKRDPNRRSSRGRKRR